ncbi:hypothetical protein CK203_050625 [Vitis vinifera]|uniref:Uncharacterized protein n=1 Tax=Vitis vinifera TaxID=29760 RepID=A0A438GK93_VITVI|nr:hypothetical protein CK203_050625 [Vitis vinifera]
MVSIAVPLLNMKLHRLPRHPPLSSLRNDFRSTTSQVSLYISSTVYNFLYLSLMGHFSDTKDLDMGSISITFPVFVIKSLSVIYNYLPF